MLTMSANESRQMIADRGPRYCVSADISGSRGQRGYIHYAETAEEAERTQERWLEESGYQSIRVHPPDIAGFDIDLAHYGRERKAALAQAEKATGILKAAVRRAADVGRAEAEIARTAGIDRMTVRSWLGK